MSLLIKQIQKADLQLKIMAVKGVVEASDGPGPRVPHTCTLCVGIAFSPYIVTVVCLIHVLLSGTDNNEEGIEIFDKSLWRVNDKFLNAFHKMLLLTVDFILFRHIIIKYVVIATITRVRTYRSKKEDLNESGESVPES
jgi:hypothetical protein